MGLGSFISNLFERKRETENVSLRSFNMAAQNRLVNDWLSFVRSYNYDLKMAGLSLIARARDLYQNDPYTKKLIAEKVKGIVGPNGFTLRNNAGEFGIQNGNYKFIKDKIANGIVNEQWWQYCKNYYVSLEGDETARAHWSTLVRTVLVDGEVFIKKLAGPKYNPFGFTTQTIAAEYCDYNLNKDPGNGNFIVMGIEVNSSWQKVAYWFRKSNPKQEVDWGYNWAQNYERITADKIIHLYVKELAHQLRGVTLLAPLGIRLKMLYGFEEAALVRSRFSAKVPAVISRQVSAMGPEGAGIVVNDKDFSGNWIADIADGEFLKVKDGYEVKNLDSDYPHQLHGEFVKAILRGVSAGGDIGYSTISNNYESVTWHSGKLEKQSERDGFREGQNWFIETYLNHFFGDDMCWLDMASLAGKFILPSGKFLPIAEKRNKFNQPVFYGRTWEYTNPMEDRQANILAVQSFQKTFEAMLGEQGMDLEEHLDAIAEERKMFADKGLGDLYDLLMTKYTVMPYESSEAKDKKEKTERHSGLPGIGREDETIIHGNGVH